MKDALDKMLPAAVKDTRRWITPEPLNLAPALIGMPLATPARRAGAMAVDLLVLALLTGVSGLWLLAGLALVLLQLRQRQRMAPPGRRAIVGWIGAALIVLLVLQEAQTRWDAWRHPQRAVAEEVEDALATVAEAASAVASAPGVPAISDAERIAQLEADLAKARKPRKTGWRQQLSDFLDDIGAGLGWGIVYFSLLPAWWAGQTVGKKLFGLQVVELTGKPMTVMRCLKRYGGYAAGLATGGLGFLQILWDANRQGLHDKAAHTAVIDLRQALRAPIQNA
jgi:uncharacterized RDD family membrane protein YckC